MLMSGFEDELTGSSSYNDYPSDDLFFSNRKNSFIDLLSNPIDIHEDNYIHMQIEFMSQEKELPNHITCQKEDHELHLDEIFDIINEDENHYKKKFCDNQSKKKNSETSSKVLNKNSFMKNCSGQIVGTLTVDQRKEKIAKYLEKRKKRNWQKKIYYDCRKRVADNRLRIKGRFVKRDQAVNVLGADQEFIKKIL
ncbi:hypothetical protein SteCoe_30738 [Stentor coeruleus]|uniref:CCT domain-containing protein n=1 Tax=Stentor coeruleus TaxID=5963 RepID=A0A1R2B306_9CILI|nr:hypothetical protein SteCoe_30738 [Stentor coeruleus]